MHVFEREFRVLTEYRDVQSAKAWAAFQEHWLECEPILISLQQIIENCGTTHAEDTLIHHMALSVTGLVESVRNDTALCKHELLRKIIDQLTFLSSHFIQLHSDPTALHRQLTHEQEDKSGQSNSLINHKLQSMERTQWMSSRSADIRDQPLHSAKKSRDGLKDALPLKKQHGKGGRSFAARVKLK